jgi:hypothetical protein
MKPVLTYMPKGMVLTDSEFDQLHRRLNSTRSTSRSVSVPMEALRHILADHSALYRRIEDLDVHLRAGGGSSLDVPPRPLLDDAPDIPQRPRRRRIARDGIEAQRGLNDVFPGDEEDLVG